MAHSRHSPVNVRSPLSPGAEFASCGSLAGEAAGEAGGQKISPAPAWKVAQNGPKRPGMAHLVYPFPIWTAAHFRATGAPSDPPSKYETAPNGPKWHGKQKIVLSENPKGRREPIWLAHVSGLQIGGWSSRSRITWRRAVIRPTAICFGQIPSFARRRDTRTGRTGAFPLYDS